jgi:arginase
MGMNIIQKIKHIVICPSEIGAGKQGTASGCVALSRLFQQHVSPEIQRLVCPVNNVLTMDQHHPPAKSIEQLYHNMASSYYQCRKAHAHKAFTFHISGDHSNAMATIASFSDTYGAENTGLIWIDAHADLHSPFTTPSGNIHGMPLAALLGIDNEKAAHRTLDPLTLHWWNRLKDPGNNGLVPKLLSRNVVLIGIRDLEIEEEKLLEERGILTIRPSEIKEKGIDQCIQKTLLHLKECNAIFTSFDVDALDKTLVPDTGTPVGDGLSLTEAQRIIDLLLRQPAVQAFEITEYNPTLSENDITLTHIQQLLHLP